MLRSTLLFCLLASTALALPRRSQAQNGEATDQGLRQGIEAVLGDSAFTNAWWAVKVVDLHTGRVLYQQNAQKSFIPASNTKLYTTAAALDQLGATYQYQTGVYIDGATHDGVLEGNLIVRGSGDPVIGGRFNEGDRTEAFRAWAAALRANGILRITGDIIGDDDLFDELPLGYGWSWDDEVYWYAAEISALSFNDNCVDISIESQQPGMPGLVSWEPYNTDYVRVVNATLTLAPDSSLVEGYARARGTNNIRLYSQVPAGNTDTESLTVLNPTLYFVHVLRETLLREGILVEGRPVDVDDIPIKPNYDNGSLRRVAVHVSPPLADIVNVVNKRSQNLYADQLIKTLAVERPREDEDLEPGSAEMGLEVAMETFLRAGIDTSRIQLVDGSGLSRMNLVTPDMTMALLQYMWNHPDDAVRTAFYDSLPVGGEDGTLRFRYASGPARGNVHAKTGTVSNASTLSGYIRSAAGTPLAFVLMCNHYIVDASDVRDAQDAIVNLLAGYQQ